MLRMRMNDFARDELGAGTIMGLLWFMLLVGITGMAVDITNGFREQTMLQATADASALAAVIDLPDEAVAVATAVAYSATNMATDDYGTVLIEADVDIGNWDASTHIFSTGALVPDAVRVRTRRSLENENPVPVNFLRIIGLMNWNVTTYAIAQRFIPECLLNDGLVARGIVDIVARNGFFNRICIHGQQGVIERQHNTHELGVTISTPDMYNDIVVPAGDYESNPGLPEAMREMSLDPRMVNHVDEIMVDMLAMENYVTPDYIDTSATSGTSLPSVEVKDKNWDFSDAEAGHIYHIQCSPMQQVGIPQGTILTGVVIISDCVIGVGANVFMSDVVLASLSGGNPGGNDDNGNAGGNGRGGTTSGHGGAGVEFANITFAANVQLGTPDNCTPGGGVQIFSNASVHFSSSMLINGLQIVVAGDVDLGAQAQGINGINVQAGGDITLASNNMFGICSGGAPNLLTVNYYRLVF